jgi:hypothetical protein
MEAEHDVEQRQVAAAQVEVLLVPWLGAPCRGAGHAGPEDAVLSVEQGSGSRLWEARGSSSTSLLA